MWTTNNRARHDRSFLRYPSDLTDDEWAPVRQYFVRADSGRSDVLDLFTDDVQIYFPKFGLARGKACFGELASGLLGSIQTIAHHISEFNYIVGDNSVAVEGTTYGADKDGAEWNGGKTPGGRF